MLGSSWATRTTKAGRKKEHEHNRTTREGTRAYIAWGFVVIIGASAVLFGVAYLVTLAVRLAWET